MEHQKDSDVSTVSFSPDDSKVVTGSTDHTARIWDASTGKPLSRAVGTPGPGVGRIVQRRRFEGADRQWRRHGMRVGCVDWQANHTADAPRE